MKAFQNITLFALQVFLVFNCNGQTVTEEVQKSFSEKFSNVASVKWDQEEPNEWEAEFVLNGSEASASFDNSGKWLETEMKLQKSDLPGEVYKALNLKFDGWEVEEVESIEKQDFKGFEIVLEKSDTEVEIVVTAEGELTIEKVIVEDEDGNNHGEEHEDEDDDNDN